MKFSAVERSGTLIPDWEGNLGLPENEQIKVHFHWPTFAEKEHLEVGSINLKEPGPEDDRRIASLATRYIETLVDKIENLQVGEESITDGKGLVRSPKDFTALIFLVFWHIWMGSIVLAQKKTQSSGAFGSSQKESRKRRRRRNRMPS